MLVIHMVQGPEAGKPQIPLLLNELKDVPSNTDLGSKNYERTPAAILLVVPTKTKILKS